MAADASSGQEAKRQPAQKHAGLRVVAIYEVVKALCMLVLAAAAFHLDHQQNFDHLVHWLEHLSLTGSNALRWGLVDMLVKLGPSKFIAIGLVTIGYAVLFGIEGIGLWLGKYWAEWFTVIATASLIPLELFETVRHFNAIKLAMLVGNIAIVIYLAKVAMESRNEREAKQDSST